MKVSVRNNNVNKALSILRKKCDEVLQEVRERQTHEKASTKRNRKKREAIARERRRQENDRPVAKR